MAQDFGLLSGASTGARTVAGLAGGSALLGFIWYVTNWQTALIVFIGVIVVAAMVAGYFWILKLFQRRKAKPMEQMILENSGSSPQAISEPARRAKLDELRRSFETGVSRFRDAGKNIYSLPWYALVGEPGSGKTEAIRHSKIGFPPGLQDQLQGAGGTLNMNWWFTNHAIILDTAGRLMFEEAPPGQTTEWKEFLLLLARVRVNCPINGLLLVIPADALIRDTADAIERKAGKIARQFDSIQRTLGVRFPVFVVITKSDLIVGFREFFDTVTDPHLQDQMMGWSNPNPLDSPFNPAEVDQHLQSVATALCKRRQGLLVDPVNTDDPNNRRLDQVDALYAFPDSLLQIAPRLRRYLEMIFVAGEWAPKPLFLRGIYFNSAMREGSALDAALAEALRVPLESLPEGRVWERDRSYFLRDLFLEKVFKEKGLVTRASNTKKLQRRRKMAVVIASSIALLTLGILTFWGQYDLRKRIGGERADWESVKTAQQAPEAKTPDQSYPLPLVMRSQASATTQPWHYTGAEQVVADNKPVEFDGKPLTRAGMLPVIGEWARKETPVSSIFKPVAKVVGDINALKRKAFLYVFEDSLVHPLLEAGRNRMDHETLATWTPESTTALADLVRAETLAAGSTPAVADKPDEGSQPLLKLDGLFTYVLPDGDLPAFRKNQKSLQETFNWVFGTVGDRKNALGSLEKDRLAGGKPHQETVNRALRTFKDYWSVNAMSERGTLKDVRELADTLKVMQGVEGDLSLKVTPAPVTMNDYNARADGWLASLKKYGDARQKADGLLATLKKNGWEENQSLRDLFKAQLIINAKQASASIAAVRQELPSGEAVKMPAYLKGLAEQLDGMQSNMAGIDADKVLADLNLKDQLDAMDAAYLKMAIGPDGKSTRLYVVKDGIYTRSIAPIESDRKTDPDLNLEGIAQAIGRIDTDSQSSVSSLQETLGKNAALKTQLDGPVGTCTQIIGYRAAARRQVDCEAVLAKLAVPPAAGAAAPQNAFAQRVAFVATRGEGIPPQKHEAVPFTKMAKAGTFEPGYQSTVAKLVLGGWQSIGQTIGSEANPTTRVIEPLPLRSRYATFRQQQEDYCVAYAGYWTDDVPRQLKVLPFTWTDFIKQELWPGVLLSSLVDINRQQHQAIADVADLTPQSLQPDLQRARTATADPSQTQLVNFQADLESKLGRWRANRDPGAAREAIIRTRPGDFLTNYMLMTGTTDGEPVYRSYFGQLFMQTLAALGIEAQRQLRDNVDKALQYCRFPLAAPRADVDPLSPADISEARQLVSSVTASGVARATSGGSTSIIRDGGETGRPEVDKLLAKLTGVSLTDAEQTRLQKMSQILQVLPDKGKITVTLTTIAPEEWTRALEAGGYRKDEDNWKFIAVYPVANAAAVGDGAAVGKRVAFGGARIEELTLPGDPVRLRMKQNQDDLYLDDRARVYPPADARDRSWSGQWDALRLIFSKGSVRLGDGTEWLVAIPTQGNDAVVIKVKFERAFPKLDDWPGAK